MKSISPKYKWDEYYNKKNNQPYGLKYVYDLLKEEHNTINLISTSNLESLDTNSSNTNLIVIDSYIGLDSTNLSILLSYVNNGNKAFIASDYPQSNLLSRILLKADSIYELNNYENEGVTINYASSKIPYPAKTKFQYQYLKKITSRNWLGFFKHNFNEIFDKEKVTPISYMNDTIINCYYLNYGKGAIIIHSNPIIFTNYYIIKKDGFKNANNIFAYLNNGSIYWNEYNSDNSNENESYKNNPLKFLFSHFTLKMAWYVFLISILIFIIFRSKREQRIIPIIYKNKNTSIEYAKAIGSLYYQKKAHHNIANEMYSIFLSDIRTRYNISTSLKTEELIEQIAIRTEIKKEFIINLFKLFSDVKYNVNATSKELGKLYQAIENFNNCKK